MTIREIVTIMVKDCSENSNGRIRRILDICISTFPSGVPRSHQLNEEDDRDVKYQIETSMSSLSDLTLLQ